MFSIKNKEPHFPKMIRNYNYDILKDQISQEYDLQLSSDIYTRLNYDIQIIQKPSIKQSYLLDKNVVVRVQSKSGLFSLARIMVQKERRSSTLESFKLEYYIHYKGTSRRLDEWKSINDFITTRKRTRSYNFFNTHQKRINNFETLVDTNNSRTKDIDENQKKMTETFYKSGKVKNINIIELGEYQIETWYFSPFPQDFREYHKLYVCEFTFEYFKRRKQCLRHLNKSKRFCPPGYEIYRHSSISLFEVDGEMEKQYCQNLSWVAKLFLDHKTLFWDVSVFFYYILCIDKVDSVHVVGYFSKVKKKNSKNNMACLLIFPPYQRKGFGRLLIEFSYEMSKIECKSGTPERPLSDLGLISFRNYWASVVLNYLKSLNCRHVSLREICNATKICKTDILYILCYHGILRILKGQYIINIETMACHILKQIRNIIVSLIGYHII